MTRSVLRLFLQFDGKQHLLENIGKNIFVSYKKYYHEIKNNNFKILTQHVIVGQFESHTKYLLEDKTVMQYHYDDELKQMTMTMTNSD